MSVVAQTGGNFGGGRFNALLPTQRISTVAPNVEGQFIFCDRCHTFENNVVGLLKNKEKPYKCSKSNKHSIVKIEAIHLLNMEV